jgi:hypothetical protein
MGPLHSFEVSNQIDTRVHVLFVYFKPGTFVQIYKICIYWDLLLQNMDMAIDESTGSKNVLFFVQFTSSGYQSGNGKLYCSLLSDVDYDDEIFEETKMHIFKYNMSLTREPEPNSLNESLRRVVDKVCHMKPYDIQAQNTPYEAFSGLYCNICIIVVHTTC